MAAPVAAGARFKPAALPMRGSFFEGASTRLCEAVYPCMVLRIAFFIPNLLPKISITGLMLLVVQLAQEKTNVLSSVVFTP